MVLWSELDKNSIESVPSGKEPGKFKYKGAKFQIPRGICKWGVSAYKSMQVDISNLEFLEWWKDLETTLCPLEPFNSNLKLMTLRLKVDEATYIFDENSKQILPEVREGLFRGQELSCLIDVEGNYFFNGSWGLIVRASQIKTYGAVVEEVPEAVVETPVLAKGKCAFI
jgi:hypothetical protein